MDDIRQNAGAIGEQIINEYFHLAKPTDDWYDSTKDGHIGDLTQETKTIRLNHKTQSFWINRSQWKKIDGVDLLFIVKMPESQNDNIEVYLVINHRNSYKVGDGKYSNIIQYPLATCLHLFSVFDYRVKELLDYSKELSTYKRVP